MGQKVFPASGTGKRDVNKSKQKLSFGFLFPFVGKLHQKTFMASRSSGQSTVRNRQFGERAVGR